MCVVSAVGQVYTDDFWKRRIQTTPVTPMPGTLPPNEQFSVTIKGLPPTREEFDALKKEVELMKKLLEAAANYDKENDEPHCEMEEKVVLLKQIANAMGVDLGEVFKDHVEK